MYQQPINYQHIWDHCYLDPSSKEKKWHIVNLETQIRTKVASLNKENFHHTEFGALKRLKRLFCPNGLFGNGLRLMNRGIK